MLSGAGGGVETSLGYDLLGSSVRYNVPQVTAMNTPHDFQWPQPYRLPDMSVGDPDGPNPLEGLTWEEMRDVIYGEREIESGT